MQISTKWDNESHSQQGDDSTRQTAQNFINNNEVVHCWMIKIGHRAPPLPCFSSARVSLGCVCVNWNVSVIIKKRPSASISSSALFLMPFLRTTRSQICTYINSTCRMHNCYAYSITTISWLRHAYFIVLKPRMRRSQYANCVPIFGYRRHSNVFNPTYKEEVKHEIRNFQFAIAKWPTQNIESHLNTKHSCQILDWIFY